MKDQNYKVQGFYQDIRQNKKQVVNARNLEGLFRGYSLDEIELQATIKNQNELDDLITFLIESRPCFGVEANNTIDKKTKKDEDYWMPVTIEEQNNPNLVVIEIPNKSTKDDVK